MKKIEKILRMILATVALCGWWGVLYPELTLTPDTYRIVTEDGSVQEENPMVEWRFSDGRYFKEDRDVYRMILEAGSSKITFKCKTFEQLRQWLQQ